MPRPGPRREPVPLRLSEAERKPVDEIADREHNGNVSDAIRTLLAEAIAARHQKKETPDAR